MTLISTNHSSMQYFIYGVHCGCGNAALKLMVPKVFTVIPLFAADIAAADPGDASKKPGADCARKIGAPTMVLPLIFAHIFPKLPKKIE